MMQRLILQIVTLWLTCTPLLSLSWAWTTTSSSLSSMTTIRPATKTTTSPFHRCCCWLLHQKKNCCRSRRPSISLLQLSESNKNNNDADVSGNTSSNLEAAAAAAKAAADSAASDTTSSPAETTNTISSAWISSFDDAGRSLIEEENKQRIDSMGEFDSNPAYASDRMEQMRAAIQARTASLGLEKSKISQQLIQEASARAAAGIRSSSTTTASNINYGLQLDLSKITNADTPNNIVREELPEGLPSMFYDPEEQMTDDEKFEADPDSQLSLWEQATKELSNAKWPSFWSALREVGLMLVVVALSAVLIIGWDKFLRDLYTSWGFIPRPEDVLGGQSLEGLELPEGWTNNMNDQDVARLENEMNQLKIVVPPSSSSSSSSGGGLPGL